MKKFQPPTGLTDGLGKYNIPRDKHALFPVSITKYSQPTAVTKYKKPVTTTRVVTLVTLGGLHQVREDWEQHLPCKSSSCTPSLEDVLAGDDCEQSICCRLNAHAVSGRPRDSTPKAGGWYHSDTFITRSRPRQLRLTCGHKREPLLNCVSLQLRQSTSHSEQKHGAVRIAPSGLNKL
jgi:hypothetical protein